MSTFVWLPSVVSTTWSMVHIALMLSNFSNPKRRAVRIQRDAKNPCILINPLGVHRFDVPEDSCLANHVTSM